MPPQGQEPTVAQATAIGRDSDIAFAIYWSNGWNNHIINMSLSSQDPSKLSMTKDAIDHGHDTWGIVYVGASGNDSYEGVNYPANWSNVIAVGGSTSNDTKDSYSNYGSGLDVAAPTSALSTDIDVDGLIGLQLHTYMWARGTSQSAALVSGLAGLILSIRPDLVRSNPEEVRNLINSNADKVGGYDYNWDPSRPGHSKEMGYGRINTSRTLKAALAGKPPYISKKKSSKEMDIDETELNITAAPNPFNPVTRIHYILPEAGHVKVEIFNTQGKRITTLVNEYSSEGEHRVMFNGSRLATGIYFTRLQFGEKELIRKVLLVK
jgi:subtilisin family serine protease